MLKLSVNYKTLLAHISQLCVADNQPMSPLDALRVIAAQFYRVLFHLRPHHPVNTGLVSLFMPLLGLFDYVIAAKGCKWLLILIFTSLPFVRYLLSTLHYLQCVLLLQVQRLTWPSNAATPRLPPLPRGGGVSELPLSCPQHIRRGFVMAVRSFTNICNAIMLNYE